METTGFCCWKHLLDRSLQEIYQSMTLSSAPIGWFFARLVDCLAILAGPTWCVDIWYGVLTNLLCLTLINHHSWIFHNFYSNPFLLETHQMMNGTWSFKSLAENSNVNFFSGQVPLPPLSADLDPRPVGWNLGEHCINFSNVGSCRSSATSDLPFTGFVSKKSPRKRWTLLF